MAAYARSTPQEPMAEPIAPGFAQPLAEPVAVRYAEPTAWAPAEVYASGEGAPSVAVPRLDVPGGAPKRPPPVPRGWCVPVREPVRGPDFSASVSAVAPKPAVPSRPVAPATQREQPVRPVKAPPEDCASVGSPISKPPSALPAKQEIAVVHKRNPALPDAPIPSAPSAKSSPIGQVLYGLGRQDKALLATSRAPPVAEDCPGSPPANPGLVGNCFVCLPETTLRLLGLKPNMDDKGASQKRLWFGRAWELRALALRRYRREVLANQPKLTRAEEETLLSDLKDPRKRELMLKMQRTWRACVVRRAASLESIFQPLEYELNPYSGVVVFMHGSGGMTYNNVRYARTLASLGFVVIAPDSMAGGEYRHRDAAAHITSNQPTPYWDDLGLYTSSTKGEFAYSTKAEAVVKDPAYYQKLYENVFRLRSLEMHWILNRLPPMMQVRGVFTMGQSEGAMTVARFDDSRYGAMIRGRIISAFSVEYCYFTPTREAATFGGSPEVATLNIIGDMDQYFGPIDSVAKSVIQDKGLGGWGADHFTGNAFKQMKRQVLRRGLTVVLQGAKHDPSETHDNFLRDLLRAFLASPHDCHQIVNQWLPDRYLSSKVHLAEHDNAGSGQRVLVKVDAMDFPSTMEYGDELFRRAQLAVKLPRSERQLAFAEVSQSLLPQQVRPALTPAVAPITRPAAAQSRVAAATPPVLLRPPTSAGELVSDSLRTPSPTRDLPSTSMAAAGAPNGFKVKLQKSNQSYGFRVEGDNARRSLVVQWIAPNGALAAWNTRYRRRDEEAVLENDHIIAVNGLSRDPDDMFQELLRSSTVELTVLRGS